jgi:hypothetical protein
VTVYRPSLYRRCVTGRWIVPGYDQVLVAPLCVLVLAWFLPFLMPRTRLSGEISLAICVAVLVLVSRGMGPSWPRWLLTGNHRLVPAITNRQEFQEI